jgi:hypothetical protein
MPGGGGIGLPVVDDIGGALLGEPPPGGVAV